MPRIARQYKKSYSNVYHVILRSINQQEIFFDKEDKRKFLKYLKNTKEKYDYDLYAYVLMNNHVHLLIRNKKEDISKIIQSLATSYACYFNKKYKRIGHVFYNRFNSKCVESLEYLLNTLRYIHYNPKKSGICKSIDYNWSSYHEYVKKSNLIDTSIILHYFNDDVKDFLYFHKNYKSCLEEEIEMEMVEKRVLDDDEAIEKVKEVLKSNNFLAIQTFDIKKRDEIIYQLAQIPKIGKKQLARILGVTERMIYRAIKNKEERT